MTVRRTSILLGLLLASLFCRADTGRGHELTVAEYRAELDHLLDATHPLYSSGHAPPRAASVGCMGGSGVRYWRWDICDTDTYSGRASRITSRLPLFQGAGRIEPYRLRERTRPDRNTTAGKRAISPLGPAHRFW